MLPVRLFKQVIDACQGYDFDLCNLLDNYRIDNEQLPILTDHLKENTYQNGLFLHDTSGLATHLLGLRFFELWQRKQLFRQHQQILWLPFAKLLKISVQPTDDKVSSLNQLCAMMDTNFKLIGDKALVIITGVDYQLKDNFNTPDFIAYVTKWLAYIQKMPCIAIGNYKPDLFTHFKEVLITLPPIFLNLHYKKIDCDDDPQSIAFPGNLLVDEITEHTRRTFRFNENNPDGVFSIDNSTVKNYLTGEIDIVPELEESVEHMQPLLTVQEVVRILVGEAPPELSKKGLSVLDTPAKWYYAALSAEKVHAKAPQKKFFLYQIAGHIIARRMTDSSMHYIINLGRVESYTIRSVKQDSKYANKEINFILKHLIDRADFDQLDSAGIISALDEAKASYLDEATKIRNLQFLQEGKNIPRQPEKLSKEVFEVFDSIRSIFRKDINDNELKEGVKNLTKEDQNASYQTIQRHVNEFFNGISSIEICQQVVNILSNNPVTSICSGLIVMLAANLLAESARNARTYFAPYAMLSLALINKRTWMQFVALPERIKMDISLGNWQQLIVADCMDALGGIHPMAHNGSYFQTLNISKANHGISWPELKTQFLYSKWLKEMLNFSGIGIKIETKNCTISFLANANSHLLTKKDQGFIMRELELWLRIETSYCIRPDQKNVLNINIEKPFERAMHLIADPRQIKIFNCGMNAKFGYFLCVPKEVSKQRENHFIHLTPSQAYMVALKFDAIGDNSNALKLYDYLCQRHPKSLSFRFSRLQCLALHSGLMQDEKLQSNVRSDLDFVTSKAVENSVTLQQQIDYLSAIYSLRVAIEISQLESMPDMIAVKLLFNAADEGENALKKFIQFDEEMSMLQLLIAVTYQRAYARLLKNEQEWPSFSKWAEITTVASEECFKNLTSYALTLHRTTSNAELPTAFNYMMCNYKDVRMLSLSMQDKADRKKHSLINDRIPLGLDLLEQVVMSWMGDFKQYMQGQKESLNKGKEMSNRPIDVPSYFKKLFVSGIEECLSDKEIQLKKISNDSKYALLIASTWRVPNLIIITWGQFHNLFIEQTSDFDLGPCLKIEFNDKYTSRENYQPTPHPDSFLLVEHKTDIPTEKDEFFSAFKNMFSQCLKQINDWNISSKTERKIPYHLFGNETRLPNLHLIKSGTQHDVIIELPNGIPIKIVLNWLQQHKFAYHWVNDKKLGRCLYLPQINICIQHTKNYNPATSNGDIVSPYIAKKKFLTNDEEVKCSDEPIGANNRHR